jgi:cardiolipin synthase
LYDNHDAGTGLSGKGAFLLTSLLNFLASLSIVLLTIVSAGHALISKRDPKASMGWIALCVLVPLGGPLLYFFFGVNRVRTRARKLRPEEDEPPYRIYDGRAEQELVRAFAVNAADCAELVNISGAVTKQPLVGGNSVDLYHNGEQAYPAMLEAIRESRESLYLTTYIFETNTTGRHFIAALGDAARRGVDVRVILDGIGEWYSLPRAGTLLRRAGVAAERFLPPRLIMPTFHINLRNHRKLLVADGVTAFAGGMNIGDRHLAENLENPARVVDMHFRLEGPVASLLEAVFLEDWAFVTGQHRSGTDYRRKPPYISESDPPDGLARENGRFEGIRPPGTTERKSMALCRVITDGPNDDLDKLSVILNAAVTAARKSITIMTPYFIPPRGLMAALQAASLRGIQVSIILPEENNLPFVHWATRNLLWELLMWGVEVYYQPPPFVHTKLFIVDGYYIHIGSANIDPRSLRLNFEVAVEVYDRPLAAALADHVKRVCRVSRRVTLQEVDSRPLPLRLRDSLAWLMSPYL